MASRYNKYIPQKTERENAIFNDAASVSTISSVQSFRAKLREDSSESDDDSDFENTEDFVSLESTVVSDSETEEKIGEKPPVGNSRDISTLSEDLDSSVETIYYEEGSEKIRELENKVASMEKYIKELETHVHLQRTKNAILRDKESVTMRKELTEQKVITEKLEVENRKLKDTIETLKKSLIDKENQMTEQKTKISSEMENKDKEISKVKGDLCNMRAQASRDLEEIACLKALLNCPNPTKCDESGNLQPPKNQNDEEYEYFDKYSERKNGEKSFDQALLAMEMENLKTTLEEEREKSRNIVGYYEIMIKAYEKKLADEKMKNEVLLWANMDHNVQNWFNGQPN